MNTRKQVCRFLGIFSSLVMIVSMFIPFFNDTNLWDTLNQSFDVYIRYAVLSFSALSLFVYLLNKKVEFAYISSGSILFFIFMRTLTLMELGYFDFVQIGYYCLLASTLLTILITFVYNIKSKYEKDELVMDIKDTQVYQPSMMSQPQQIIQQPVLEPNVVQNQFANSINNSLQPTNFVEPQIENNYSNMNMTVQPVMPNSQVTTPVLPVEVMPMAQLEQPQNIQNYNFTNPEVPIISGTSNTQVAAPEIPNINSTSTSTIDIPPINTQVNEPMFGNINGIPTMQPMQSMQLLNREEPKDENVNPVVSTFMNASQPNNPSIEKAQAPLEAMPQAQNNNNQNNSLDIFNQPMR